MNNKYFWYLAATGALLVQGCNKDRSQNASQLKVSFASSPVGTNLQVNASTGFSTFQIISFKDNLSSEVAGQSMLDGGTGDVAAYTGAAHQQWRVTNVDSGYYTIMNDGSGKFATSYPYHGANVLIQASADSAGRDAQLWAIVSVGPGAYKAINKASGLAITNTASDTLSLAPYANNNTQWWGCHPLVDMAYRDDQVVKFFQRKHGSISFDQGTSIPLTDGRSIWIGCDTYSDANGGFLPDGKYKCYGNIGQFFDIRNSGLIQPASQSWNQANTNNLITTNDTHKYQILASPDSVNPGSHGTNYTWPGVGVQLGNHVYMYAKEGSGDGFYNKVVIYDLTVNGGNNWGRAIRHEVPGASDQTQIDFTEGMVRPGDGYVYVYGNSNVFLAKLIYVARFAENDPFNWKYWNGSIWAASPIVNDASQLPLNGGGTKVALSNCAVSYVNGKYVLVEMDYGYGCPDANSPHNIYISTSTSPIGPFSQRKQVFSIVDKIYGFPSNYYIPAVHPQFDNGKRELLITYDINYSSCSGFNSCKYGELDPFYYQVKAVRVPYAIAGL